MEKQFRGPLQGTSTHRIAVGHMVRNVDVTHVPVIPCHDLSLHSSFAVITKIPFFWWRVHVSQHVNVSSVLPSWRGQISPGPHPYIACCQFQFFGPKSEGMSFLLGHTVPHECIFRLIKSSKSLGDEKKLSINVTCRGGQSHSKFTHIHVKLNGRSAVRLI